MDELTKHVVATDNNVHEVPEAVILAHPPGRAIDRPILPTLRSLISAEDLHANLPVKIAWVQQPVQARRIQHRFQTSHTHHRPCISAIVSEP